MNAGEWKCSFASCLGVLLVCLAVLPGCREAPDNSEALTALGQRWVDAWNRREPAPFLALFDEDLLFWAPPLKAPMRGKRDVARYLPSMWNGWSQMQLRPNAILTDQAAGKIAIDWTLIATDARTQNRVQLDGAEILQVRNGVLVSDHGIYNACSLLAQLSATPPKGAEPSEPSTGSTTAGAP